MDPLSYHLLNGLIHWMDKLGADEWNLHAVATAVSESSLDD
jgi:recombinational DNA repair protein RecR